MHLRSRRSALVAAVACLALAAGACENNPLQTDDDHPDVNGLVLIRNGQVLARVTPSGTTGQIQVPVGGSVGIVAVVFDKDGDTVLLGADEYIEVEVANQSIARFDHASTRSSNGTFHGVSAGTTSFTIRLRHGDPAHTDFGSSSIPLVVTP